VLVFSHDPKLDVPALAAALGSGAGFVGALGSRRTTAERATRLLEAGVAPDDVQRIHAPCGLDIGCTTPEETAVSVLAQIIAARNGRDGGPLERGGGSIRATPSWQRRRAAPDA
jgi:xanthine dehydrogenase accessory factor